MWVIGLLISTIYPSQRQPKLSIEAIAEQTQSVFYRGTTPVVLKCDMNTVERIA